MRDIKSVSIVEDQRRWNGQYEVEGKTLCISSAYGSRRVPMPRDKGNAGAAAKAAFLEIVREQVAAGR
jgi:hypothetical protein